MTRPEPLLRPPALWRCTRLSAAAALLLAGGGALAQGVCGSDGQPPPRRLVERFIRADCADCWQQPPAPPAGPDDLVLDWIVPGRLGDEAPLAAAATRDALTRLQALRRPLPPASVSQQRRVVPPTPEPGTAGRAPVANPLRVAHGVALGGYLGTAIHYRPAPATRRSPPAAVTVWLVLLEALPAGTEGSPVSRFLVRNLLQMAWNGHTSLSNNERIGFSERRPMQIAEGARPERLLVAGWVQDARGRVLAAARSGCIADADAEAPAPGR